MEPEKINHPYLTAIKRTSLSVPTRYLLQHNLLKGRILDFGCGYGFDTDELKRQGYDITGYDYYYRPEYPDGKFDTILCNYVLNVLEPYAQAEVMMNVTNLLAPTGTAFFAVRRDLTEEGFRLHAIHRQYTYQCNVRLPFQSLERNSSYELYQYQHFNKLTRKEGEAMNVVLQYVKQKVDERYHPDGYNVGINVNEAAGQSVFHVHMHLIPRYNGDVPNPKGGVRGVIPSKQSYDANEGFSSPALLERKKAYTIEEKRNEHGNAYIPWEEEADKLLCRLYDEGNSISVLAEMFERTKGAIRSRLKKLGKIS